MKVVIEIDRENIGALQDLVLRCGGIITEMEELGDTCYVRVLSPGPNEVEACLAFQEASGLDPELCRKFVMGLGPRRIRMSTDTGKEVVEALNLLGACAEIE